MRGSNPSKKTTSLYANSKEKSSDTEQRYAIECRIGKKQSNRHGHGLGQIGGGREIKRNSLKEDTARSPRWFVMNARSGSSERLHRAMKLSADFYRHPYSSWEGA